ncbi:hypothetical protein HPB47_012408 [Ixodes persulcatus]|uniref:Uncharacterized protein n=1 Tax=Ixodes persulcatus TaxID=34615 RepID=A0AC60NTP0_IXOPE|nr:hypothetical protein HPB47_012408 [Ixodes persulcatus]
MPRRTGQWHVIDRGAPVGPLGVVPTAHEPRPCPTAGGPTTAAAPKTGAAGRSQTGIVRSSVGSAKVANVTCTAGRQRYDPRNSCRLGLTSVGKLQPRSPPFTVLPAKWVTSAAKAARQRTPRKARAPCGFAAMLFGRDSPARGGGQSGPRRPGSGGGGRLLAALPSVLA